jgi:hypothetical protein
MQTFVSLTSESKRIKELLSFQILDTPNEKEFDNLVKVAAQIFNTPIAAITFLDEKRQWIKASVGLSFCETDRKHAVCNYTIRQDSITEITDMSTDERFSSFPFVAGAPFCRFYAGIPLKTESGYLIGVLCLMDTKTRSLSEEEKNLLGAFARSAMAQVEISSRNRELININEIRNRISCAINHNVTGPMVSKTTFNLQEDDLAGPLSADNLNELNNLLKKEVDNINMLLNKMNQQRRVELQYTVNNLQNPNLKKLVSSLMEEMEVENVLK